MLPVDMFMTLGGWRLLKDSNPHLTTADCQNSIRDESLPHLATRTLEASLADLAQGTKPVGSRIKNPSQCPGTGTPDCEAWCWFRCIS